MENTVKNRSYYENLSLEEAIKEHRSCFNEKGEVIDNNKLFEVLRNKELFHYLFSDEKLLQNAKQDTFLMSKGASEIFLGKAFPPSWYWKMPDYYYPGIYLESRRGISSNDIFFIFGERSKIKDTSTRNECVLNDCGWKRRKYDVNEYFNDNFPNLKIVFAKDNNVVSIVKINPETQEELGIVSVPFSLICGVFLKCRELEYDKPWQLRAHDYHDKFPNLFEKDHHIVRDPETKEIISYGDWKPEEE